MDRPTRQFSRLDTLGTDVLSSRSLPAGDEGERYGKHGSLSHIRKVKPEACLLWPLAIFEGKSRILSVDDDIFEFSCNARHAKGTFSLSPAIVDNIERVFGVEFTKDLQDAADKGLNWTRIPLRSPIAS